MRSAPTHHRQRPEERGLDHSRLAALPANDRLRVLAAATETFAMHGYRETTVEHLKVQIDPVAFDTLFTDKEDCFLQIYDHLLDQAGESIVAATPAGAPWPERLSVGLAATFELIEANPAAARLLLVEAPCATRATIERHFRAIDRLSPFMREGHALSEREIPPLIDSVYPSGVAYALATQLVNEGASSLSSLYPEMLGLLAMPFLEPEQLRELLARSSDRSARNGF